MISKKIGVVESIVDQNEGLDDIRVKINGEIQRAYNYPKITGNINVGDEVLLNTTAVELSLGTGGYHFVIANLNKLESNFTKNEFENAVRKVQDYIRKGDIYQANLTQRFKGKTTLSSYELYRDLRRFSPAPFGAFLNFEHSHILSNSPERFIKCVDKKIETRPIKGTRPRGKNREEDLRLQEELRNSEKDRAELLMIVDLERNDIGRISKIGSVKVPELFVIEPYANVNHLVATVVGELEDNKDCIDVIKATFPGGSITGAPKIRSMEIIDELEPTQRNVYTGSIGYIGFNGDMDLNIAIRTIIKQDENIYFQVGGGMTWDSNPEDEYQETLDKAQSIMKALRGYYEE